jgi:uncharacterized cupredoxin-like copper-binding protein
MVTSFNQLLARSIEMNTNRKLTLSLIAGLMLAVMLACNAVTGGRKERTEKSPVTSNSEVDPGSSTVFVTLGEFDVAIEPSRPAAGEVTFVVRNEGHIQHDFRIRGNGVDHRTPMIDAGGEETFTITLEEGTYDYECTVEGHAMLGMEGSLTVAAGPSN